MHRVNRHGSQYHIAKKDLAEKVEGHLLYIAPITSLKTVAGENVTVHGKLDAIIQFGSRSFQHCLYVRADITDASILGLGISQKTTLQSIWRRTRYRLKEREFPY